MVCSPTPQEDVVVVVVVVVLFLLHALGVYHIIIPYQIFNKIKDD